MSERLEATYLLETPFPIADAAAVLAGEQSTGTFVRLAAETDALREAHAARVEEIEELGEGGPSLPGRYGASGTTRFRRARIKISWPYGNVGPSLPNVLATVAGNLYELKEVSGLRLLDIEFPRPFADAYSGPQFAIAGTRRLAGIERGPLIGTIIKPSIGLSPEETAELVDKLCAGGIDFIKDDELQANGSHCPLEARVAAVMRVINKHADRTGRKVMYAFNITDELDQMLRHHDVVEAAGGTCVMVSLASCGLVGVSKVRAHSRLPIHGHRNGWGYLSRAPLLGFEYPAWAKFWRLAGVDHLHVNGLDNKFSEPNDSVIASARSCLTPLFSDSRKDYVVMPVFSSGQWAGQAPATWQALQSADVIYACGGGIMAHPDGIAAGVASIR
jgi:ribulose-bisphosphate carboxylase large chain